MAGPESVFIKRFHCNALGMASMRGVLIFMSALYWDINAQDVQWSPAA